MSKYSAVFVLLVLSLLITTNTFAEQSSALKKKWGVCARHLVKAKGCNKNLAACSTRCLKGEVAACHFLTCIYQGYEAVKKDYVLAFKYAKKGCELGSGGLCNSLSVFYERGDGVVANSMLAHEYCVRACALGHGGACSVLGLRYWNGTYGLPEDKEKGVMYLQLACEYAPRTCEHLANIHYAGRVGDQFEVDKRIKIDHEKALSLFKRTCATGKGAPGLWIADSCFKAGMILWRKGAGGDDDDARIEAEYYFFISCRGGMSEACETLGLMRVQAFERSSVQAND